MATAADFKQLRELFARLTFKQTGQLLDDALEDGHEGLRRWAAGDDNEDRDRKKPEEVREKALLLSSEAAALCDVERQRINKWEKDGRLRRAITTPSGPLFWRVDVLRVKAEGGTRRSRGVAAEGAAEE